MSKIVIEWEYTDILLNKLKELFFTFYDLCCEIIILYAVKICQSDWFNKKAN